MPNASKTRAITLLAATFVAGVAVGTGVRAVWARYGVERRAAARPGLDRMMANLTDELHLTPAQHDSVRAILGRHFGQLSVVWDSVKPRFDAIRSRMDSEVVRQLTPTQAVQYRDHVTRYRHQKEQASSDSSRKKP
jgi:hypothetical protein